MSTTRRVVATTAVAAGLLAGTGVAVSYAGSGDGSDVVHKVTTVSQSSPSATEDARHSHHAERGDDHGRHAEPGDDHGQHAEPGDDHGEDDHGGHREG